MNYTDGIERATVMHKIRLPARPPDPDKPIHRPATARGNMMTAHPLLPGGPDSLLAALALNPNGAIELRSRFIRLRGMHIEGRSYRTCIFDDVRDRIPATVKIIDLRKGK